MEAELDQLLASAKQAARALDGPLAPFVDDALRLSQNPDSQSQSGALRTKILDTIQTLGKIQQILTPPQVQFMDAIFSATNTQVLVCAAKYHLADILHTKGPLSTTDLAAEAGIDEAACGQIVRYLVEMGFFTHPAGAAAAGGPVVVDNNRTSQLLRTDHWTTWHNWVGLYACEHYDILPRLPAAIAAGERRTAAQIYYGTDEPIYQVMERLGTTAAFHRAIGAFSIAEAPGLLADYHWAEVADEVVTDIGAGAGDFVWHYLQAFPDARAAAFELPQTAELIRKRFEDADGATASRLVEVRSGDFFKDELPRSAAYFLKFVFHNWDDEHCIKLLKRIRESIILKPGVSRVVVGEHIILEGKLGSFARYADIRMLSRVKNRERTLEEYRVIAEKGGFTLHEVVSPRGCLTQVIDLRPA
ncbi:putative o-methyltransferase 2 [Diaporthe ampelina]|uniref:Putative o-methyltransferase 2 n=1 Tax=Diaporthe ampelina TaxID=1214573 RepID=A0A0G2FYB3_9PEZI|nr:putative o-methyltransferase 2 [Diaporthe ampelina]